MLLLLVAAALDGYTLLPQVAHPAPAISLLWLADGSGFLTGEDDVRRWTADGVLIASYPQISGHHISLSPDGKTLASYNANNVTMFYDVATMQETGRCADIYEGVHWIDNDTVVGALPVSAKSTSLQYCKRDGRAFLFRAGDDRQKRPAYGLAYNPKRRVAAMYAQDAMLLRTLGAEQPVYLNKETGFGKVFWAGDTLVWSVLTKTHYGVFAKKWDDREGRKLFEMSRDSTLAVTRDGELLVSNPDHSAHYYDGEGKLLKDVASHPRLSASSPDGTRAIIARIPNRAQSDIALVEAGGQQRHIGGTSPFFAVATSTDRRFFVTAGADGAVRWWTTDGRMQRAVSVLERLPLYAVAVSHDNAFVYAGGQNGWVHGWDMRGERVMSVKLAIESVVSIVEDKGTVVVLTRDKKLHFLGRDGTAAAPAVTVPSAVGSMADGGAVAVISANTDIHVVDIAKRQLSATYPMHQPVYKVATDGKVFAVSFLKGLAIYDMAGKRLHAHSRSDEAPYYGLAFNGEGDLVALDIKRGLTLFNGKLEVLQSDAAGASAQAVTWLDDRHFVYAAGDQPTLLVRLRGSEKHISLMAREQEWIAFSPEGYFDSSPDGGQLVAAVDGKRGFGIDQFAARLNRPDLVLSHIQMGDAAYLAHLKLQHDKRLRRLGLAADAAIGEKAPEARILTSTTHDGSAEVTFALDVSVGKLKSYQLYVNDVPVKTKPVNGQHYEGKEVVVLGPGSNKIEVSARNAAGVESLRARAFAVGESNAKPNLYFVGFGVSAYKRKELALAYAAKDARDLAETFQRMRGERYQDVVTKVYLDAQVNAAAVSDAKKVFARASENDVVVLFIAGHGLHDNTAEAPYYYLSHAADPSRLAGTALRFEQLEALFEGIKPRNKLFLIDTCESGERDEANEAVMFAAADKQGVKPRAARGLKVSTATPPRPQLLDRDRFIYADVQRRTGAIVLSSSRGGEFSYESAAIENGYFTEALLAALAGTAADADRDGNVTIDELRRYVIARVPEDTKGLQHPVVDHDNLYAKFGFPVVR